jgi:hypothetical protein
MCRADQNTEPILLLNVDRLAYNGQVVPAIRDIVLSHTMAFRDYSVPFATVWHMTALHLLFPREPPRCCDACASTSCVDDFHFSKVLGADPAFARFSWSSKAQIRMQNKLGDIDTALSLTMTLEGDATISPDLVVMRFIEGHPNIKMTDTNFLTSGKSEVTFDDDISCISSLSQWAVARPLHLATTIPHLKFLVNPK